MLLRLNGREVDTGTKSRLSDVIKGEPYEPGALIAVTRSTSSIQKETSEFEVVTAKGSFVIRLNDSESAKAWRDLIPKMVSSGVRWKTTKVLAIGAFPSSVEVDRGHHAYRKYDCFFALGGYDSSTTYMMIARTDHVGAYGVREGKFGKATRGRYVLDLIPEGERITDIRPVVMELSEKDSFATSDLKLKPEDGMSVDTYVGVDLDRRSPVSSEQFLVIAGDGVLKITDRHPTYSANSSRTDVSLIKEHSEVREEGDVTVRHEGPGTGRLYFYRLRRQLSQAHNHVGTVTNGQELLRLAPEGSVVTLVSNPSRIMVIGMTQKEAQDFLEKRGVRQKRTGLQDDNARVVEQEPELTMEIREGSEVETLGVKAEKISILELDAASSPKTVRYFRKMTGLDHKPVGTMKVFFTFPDMPMITFEGNAKEAAVLLPEKHFDPESPRGQIAVTNMSRPNKGTIGIRLEGSPEFGPTGEERYGTNVVGSFVSDINLLMGGIKDGDIVYVREVRHGEKVAPAKHAEPAKAMIPAEVAEIAAGEFVTHAPPTTPFGAPPTREEAPRTKEEAPKKKPRGSAKAAAPKKAAAKPKKASEPKKKTGGRLRTKRPKQE